MIFYMIPYVIPRDNRRDCTGFPVCNNGGSSTELFFLQQVLLLARDPRLVIPNSQVHPSKTKDHPMQILTVKQGG